MESDTGAYNEAMFWPPVVGTARQSLTKQTAERRAAWLAANGVTTRIERSDLITWPEPTDKESSQ